MAFRYKHIKDLNETFPGEQIYAVYDDPIKSRTGIASDDHIINALNEDDCKLVVWRSDEDPYYYQGIGKDGRIRDLETSMTGYADFFANHFSAVFAPAGKFIGVSLYPNATDRSAVIKLTIYDNTENYQNTDNAPLIVPSVFAQGIIMGAVWFDADSIFIIKPNSPEYWSDPKERIRDLELLDAELTDHDVTIIGKRFVCGDNAEPYDSRSSAKSAIKRQKKQDQEYCPECQITYEVIRV